MRRFLRPIAVLLLPALASCGVRGQARSLHSPAEFARPERRAEASRSHFLKAHLKSGSVFVFSEWEYDEEEGVVRGTGVRLGINRDAAEEKAVAIDVDSVALFETNRTKVSANLVPLTLFTAVSVGVSVLCILHPKECFGSCPTFYACDTNDDRPVAEGFSSSVAPALEATDVDHLFEAAAGGDAFRIRMRNEALETHVVRSVRLLAAPRKAGERVYRSASGPFVAGSAPIPPIEARSSSRDILADVSSFDRVEWWCPADSSDLAARETLFVRFDPPPGGRASALLIASRESFLSTWLFYQGLAFLGRSAGAALASIERDPSRSGHLLDRMDRALGGIEVLAPAEAGRSERIAEVRESGPLASDVVVIPLPAAWDGRLLLRLPKGRFRIDQLALISLEREVETTAVEPSLVLRGGRVDAEARERLVDPERTLVAMPGDEYEIVFPLPRDSEGSELFLESRGYYLEWIRERWLEEENLLLAARLFREPERAFRELAGSFARVEPELEERFWRSRYAAR